VYIHLLQKVPDRLIDLRDSLYLNLAKETKVEMDDEWLAGTNIGIPEKVNFLDLI
jgi:hypothetical protein